MSNVDASVTSESTRNRVILQATRFWLDDYFRMVDQLFVADH